MSERNEIISGETQLVVVGNATSDPELRYVQSGLAVVNFTIAASERVFDKQQGKSVDGDSLFIRCSAWREFAEHIAATVTKGMRVIAQGNLKQRSYETKDGEKRISLELELTAIGPDLRFSTATVQRAQTSGTQQRNRAAQSEEWNAPGYSKVAPF